MDAGFTLILHTQALERIEPEPPVYHMREIIVVQLFLVLTLSGTDFLLLRLPVVHVGRCRHVCARA